MKKLLFAVPLIFMTGVVSSAFAEETIKLRCDISLKTDVIKTFGEAVPPSSARVNVDVEVVLIGKLISIEVSGGEGVAVANKYSGSASDRFAQVLADNSDNNKWDIKVQYSTKFRDGDSVSSIERISIDRRSGSINIQKLTSIKIMETMSLETTTGTGQCSKVDTAKRKF